MSYRLGVDTGGTFTDFTLVDEADWSYRIHKTPSNPAEPSASFEQGLRELADLLGLDLGALAAQISLIVHGTTVATNAVLTSSGSKVALLTTHGFRDALQLRRGMREEVLNNKLAAPTPLVPRFLRFGIPERVTFEGAVLEPLDGGSVAAAADACRDEAVDAVAVCFLHAYANPRHEREAEQRLRERLPGVYVCTSSDLLAQIRLFERISSTVLNAYTGPLIDAYLGSLVERLEGLGFAGTLLVMQSNGGVMSPEVARGRAAATLLSGPAGVPLAAARYARAAGHADCISVDMGGTSFDAALIRDGAPGLLQTGGWINRQRIALPMLAIHTIGAGGGSIGWVDRSGFLRMGPQSAGAVPGPACYGRGGTLPTSTDANVVLGYLNPANFLGGRMRLDADAARDAIERHVGRPLGLEPEEAAAAMFQVINTNMTAGIREVSVDQGADPRDFLLVVVGGAGPIHAGAIAAELEIERVLVPRDSAVCAAAGMLLADVRQDVVRALPGSVGAIAPAAIAAAVEQLVAELRDRLGTDGFRPDEIELSASCDLRYEGQFHEVVVPAPVERLRRGLLEDVVERFGVEHDRLYGWSSPGSPVELVNLRLTGTIVTRKPERPAVAADPSWTPARAVRERRRAYLEREGGFGEVDVLDGLALPAGAHAAGPLLVELPTTTLFVPEPYELLVTAGGDFLLTERLTGATK
jgi:N-methylhydantoinase A